MNKILAIVVGIVLIGVVLYTLGVFDPDITEPIISDTINGDFKHTFVITYVDGTIETVTSDSILAKILHNDIEVVTITPYLYIKPLNPSELSYASIDIDFSDTFYWMWEIECTGGDLYATLTDYTLYSPTYLAYLTAPDNSDTINDIGYTAYDIDSDFQEVGHHAFPDTNLDNIVGVTALGLPGTFELRMTYHGTAQYTVPEVSTDVYTFSAPFGTMVWTFTTDTDQGPSDITFDWDMPTP